MCYLLRDESGYKLCYGEPKNPYIKTSNGTYFCADEYQQMCNEEKEVQANFEMEDDNWPIGGWADVCQNDLGLNVSVDVAEYILQGKYLNENEFVEITFQNNVK